MTRRLATLLACGPVLLGATAALGAAPRRTPALVEKGKTSFERNCVACHGPRGEGDGAAADALDPKPRNLVTQPPPGGAAKVFQVLDKGVKGTAMLAFKHLPEEERWALAYYVESLAAGKAK